MIQVVMGTITESIRNAIRIHRHDPPVSYHIPKNIRVYAVGDIHGRADLLKRLHERMIRDRKERPTAKDIIIYLGDYVDRSLQVREVLDILTSGPPDGFQAVYLRGNHEETLLHFLDDASYLESWISMGAQSTLLSYQVPIWGCVVTPERASEIRRTFLQLLPRRHFEFFRSLRTTVALGDYLFVHAGIRPGVPLSCQRTQDLLWIRNEFLASENSFDVRVVHGHSVVPYPEILPNRVNVETGAYATGVLSCAVLEDDQVHILDTRR